MPDEGFAGVPHGRIFELFKNLRAAFYDLWLEALWASKLALLIFVAVFAALMCWSWSARWLP